MNRSSCGCPPCVRTLPTRRATFAGASQDPTLRQRLFTALWSDGRDIGAGDELDQLGGNRRDDDTAATWQEEFDTLPEPVTPTLILPDGYVSRGLGALARLAELAIKG